MILQQFTPKTRTVYVGDVLEIVEKIKSNSISVIGTSPAYFQVRDYKIKGQLGHEKNVKHYLLKMEMLMDEFKRILRSTGTFWLNIGDKYNNKNNSRFGIPSRLDVYALDSGWRGINFIPWEKENAMPGSMKTRLFNKWEPLMLYAKGPNHYFNLDGVRIPLKHPPKPFNVRVRDAGKGKWDKLYKAKPDEIKNYKEKYKKQPESNAARLHRFRPGNPNNKQDHTLGPDGKPKANYKGFNERWSISGSNKKGKNPGDVLHINAKPFKGAHFATFPEKFAEFIVKAGCPKNGIILDPFFGAGTIGVVAEKLGLQWCGIELKPAYARMAIKRIGVGRIV
ncbi:MAG: site-specific DNA-methyltransferase [Thaumarchaeota archaeon]|nr:site-specific DNA-methyltransferase [Nitrososphaerota archaeon]